LYLLNNSLVKSKIQDEFNRQSYCGNQCWSCGSHERPGDL
jgi:hypothetical protein